VEAWPGGGCGGCLVTNHVKIYLNVIFEHGNTIKKNIYIYLNNSEHAMDMH